ncbi:type 1 glutamine amidotransferase [Bacillus sp. APMAM]|nr:type 1 glutamine amidotransferase [Bacillus sp. APMAM]RTZ53404.1 type 1 glutamine amidotransferase [Bacillus sp. SAJ1]
MRIHYIQNDPIVTLGFINEWIHDKNHTLTCTKMYENETFPQLNSFDLLIILGGRMGAYDEEEFPWLITEKKFIREAIDSHKWVLGICLGVQLLANVLGSKVYPHSHQEIGWWPISLTEEALSSPLLEGLPKEIEAFEHHGDTFDLPEGAVRLATSGGCTNQAFSYGDRVIGIQFHPEFTNEMIHGYKKDAEGQVFAGIYCQDPSEWIDKHSNLNGAKTLLFTILNNIEKAIMKLEV